MRVFDNIYRSIDGVTNWTAEFFNAIFRSVDDRLHRLEERDVTLDGILGEIVGDAQKTIQATLDPGIASIRAMQERGFLLGRSDTPVTLLENAEVVFFMTEGDNRDLFTPSVFTVATRVETPDDYAILRTVSYDRMTGRYLAVVMTVEGNEGPWTDWIVGALAGTTIAQINLLHAGFEALDLARSWASAPVGANVDGAGTRSAFHHAERAREERTAVVTMAGEVSRNTETTTLAAAAAGRSADRALMLAENPENVEIVTGVFSALHWARKAAKSALDAAVFNPEHFLRRDGVPDQVAGDNSANAANTKFVQQNAAANREHAFFLSSTL